MILCIETATDLCSVALCSRDGVICLKESIEARSHASRLTVIIDEILKENSISPKKLEAVAVSKGPGSYTGLRIGVSAAKGIAFGASVPLIGIDTTFSMFRGMLEKGTGFDSNSLFCPMLDARRMEVYYALYDTEGIPVKEISAEIIDENSFSAIPENRKIIFFGDGATKCRNILKRQNIRFEESFRISAGHLFSPAYKSFDLNDFEDVAYFEPFYLKDFVTTRQKKSIL